MKNNINQFLNLLAMSLVVFFSTISCSDKLEENDGQLSAGDLDFTLSENMVLPLIGAYSETYSRGWEDPLLIGVR
ncbi:MAG: RagB/SusD family nutrient uptake outer membrane protein, partial [Algibacter sp.]